MGCHRRAMRVSASALLKAQPQRSLDRFGFGRSHLGTVVVIVATEHTAKQCRQQQAQDRDDKQERTGLSRFGCRGSEGGLLAQTLNRTAVE